VQSLTAKSKISIYGFPGWPFAANKALVFTLELLQQQNKKIKRSISINKRTNCLCLKNMEDQLKKPVVKQ